jgi:diguanylate cyclase (GGDEF)-like protein
MKVGDTRRSRGLDAVRRTTEKGAPATEERAPGAVDDVTSILGIPEHELTAKVRSAILKLMEEVDRLRQELEKSTARISYLETLADQDTLLPVPNRRAFVRELTRMMAFSERYGAPGSLLYFDIDSMKDINDQFGHAAGDAALAHVADVLERNIRSSDVVGRLGGDEFGVILAQADPATANEKATLLADAIEKVPFEWHGRPLKISMAVGAYTFKGGENAGEALDAADRAMYVRKQGKNEGG